MHRRNGRRRGHCECMPKGRMFDHGTDARNKRNLPAAVKLVAAEEEICRVGNDNGTRRSRRLLVRQLVRFDRGRADDRFRTVLLCRCHRGRKRCRASGASRWEPADPAAKFGPSIWRIVYWARPTWTCPSGGGSKRASKCRRSSARSWRRNSVTGAWLPV